MLRFLFFLLLLASMALATAIYLAATAPAVVLSEVNPAALKIVGVTDSAKAQQEALAKQRIVDSLSGAACVDFSVKPADLARAQSAFAELRLGARLNVRTVEEFSRFGVSIAQADKRAAETLVANLKKAAVKDVSLLPDNGISLGVFSSEEAARRYLAELEAKAPTLIKGVAITPRNGQVKETIFTVREPDINQIARLTLMQRDFESSVLKAVTCAASPAATAPAPGAQ